MAAVISRGDLHGLLGYFAAPFGERHRAAAAVVGIAERGDEAARAQAVDHALDGGGVEADQPPEMVLRAGADLVKLGERGELSLRQRLDHAAGEDRGVALHGDAQQEADLLVEHIAAFPPRRRGSRHNL